ncbi:sulfatase-like hydrolase/transferase [Halorussus salinisoli]|uniref:sulfatase-like hydrolase/transferase n=1 Tax=Halorussus salinisoli TaxID=2558242 RepID=UPI002A909620|nr:sulfatase-like hydrolase/transferase [Halorussus salinisoli]
MRNIVLVTFDSLRADHCSFMGYERETTPTLDTMADNGIVFENAIAPASRTNPAMAGAFTGEPLVAHDRVANPEHSRRHLRRHGTLAETLTRQGYEAIAFCPNAYASRYYGFDRGFDRFEDFLFDSSWYQKLFDRQLAGSSIYTAFRNLRNYVRRQEAFKTWDTYIDEIEQTIAGRDTENPFFLWVFSLDTHFPYLTPRRYRRWSTWFDNYYYNWRCNQLIDQFNVELSAYERQQILNIYDDSLAFGDHLLRELQDRLAEYDPVFVVHGDHGEAFDERGIYGHFYPELYEENIRVPLVVSGKETPSTRVNRPVSLLQLPDLIQAMSTLSEEQALQPEQRRALSGNDWVVASDFDGRRNRQLTAVRTKNLKYILRSANDEPPQRELYDLADDPNEQSNVAETHAAADALHQLAARRRTHERELLTLRQASNQLTLTAGDGDPVPDGTRIDSQARQTKSGIDSI